LALGAATYASVRTRRLERSLHMLGPADPIDLRKAFMKLKSEASTYLGLLRDAEASRSIVDPQQVWPSLWDSMVDANSKLWALRDEVADGELQQFIGGACRFVIIGEKLSRPISAEDAERLIESCDGGLGRIDKLQGR
jgi:hypothetical protein